MEIMKVFGADGVNPASATNPFPASPAGNIESAMTQVNGSIPSSAATITFNAPSATIVITSYGTTPANLFVSFSGLTATTGTGNFVVAPSTTFKYQGFPLSSISIIGASAAGNYAILAY